MATINLGPNGEITEETQIQFTSEERVYQMRAEIERLRKENEELHTIINNLRGIFFNGAYVAESRVAKLKIARTALGEDK